MFCARKQLRYSFLRLPTALFAEDRSSKTPNTAEPVPVITAPSAPQSSMRLLMCVIAECRLSGTSSKTLYIRRAICPRSPAARAA